MTTDTRLRPLMLVEDSPNDVELTMSALERCRVANPVIVARDGAEALDYLIRGRNGPLPAVVLLDLKMPRVDGLEVLEQLRAQPRTRRLPVVMLTSSREEQDLVRSYDLGVNAFVVKPVGSAEFHRAIRDLGMFWAILNEPPPGSTEGGPNGNLR